MYVSSPSAKQSFGRWHVGVGTDENTLQSKLSALRREGGVTNLNDKLQGILQPLADPEVVLLPAEALCCWLY